MTSLSGFFRRAALGLWFCAIAVLGLVQFHARAFDDGRFVPSTVVWMWLGGSVLLAILGLAQVVRALRKPGRAAAAAPDP